MNPLLILILIPLVIAIGYILSRPFENPSQFQEAPSSDDALRDRYKALLKEIKRLQDHPDAKQDPAELNHLIAAKKQQAAALLREINPSLEKDAHP